MIKVLRKPAPEKFECAVRKKGMNFLKPFMASQTKPTAQDWKNKDYWNEVKPELRSAFEGRCAYLAMREYGDGEIDHFVSKNINPELAYEWENYRFANSEVNKKKSNSTDILDPFIVEDHWFRVDLVTGKVLSTDYIPAEYREVADNTIKKLGLNKNSYRLTRLSFSEESLKEHPSESHMKLLSNFAPLVWKAILEYWNQKKAE